MNKISAAIFSHLLFLFGLSGYSQARAQVPNPPPPDQSAAPVSSPSSVPIAPLSADVPGIGAEVWITPDTTTDQMDMWMKLLADHHMPYARIWLDEKNISAIN